MNLSKCRRNIGLFAVVVAWMLVAKAVGEVRLPHAFASHMVLQQQKPVTVWGWANPGEKVAVDLAGNKQQVTANDQGEWLVTLPAMKAGGPFTLSVAGSNTLRLEDLLVGEVWLCSGQSNMEMGVGMALNAKEEIAAANYPSIRLLLVPHNIATLPQTDVNATWKVCSPATIAEGGWGGFSASAYYFGRELHKTLKVPVGLIDSSWGGTLIEPWTPPVGFAAEPALKSIYDAVLVADPRSTQYQERLTAYLTNLEGWMAGARKSMAEQAVVSTMPAYPGELTALSDPQRPTALYNGMIHPLLPMALRGSIWYQGESNHNDGMLYVDKTRALVNGWRKVFKQDDLAFYYVQIAPYQYGSEDPAIIARFWEAQAAAMVIPNTGMVVTTDIGNVGDIHPTNKQEVGRRLALWALAKTYHQPGVVASGPVFKSMAVVGKQVRLTFEQTGSGLVSRDGKPLSWFEMIDGDKGDFVPATATIEGNTVVLAADAVAKPVAVRFAWSKLAEPNLSNKEGLPALPFRAGEVPDTLVRNVSEAGSYQLVYDLDLGKVGHDITYRSDNRSLVTKPFDRVAYYLELVGADGKLQYLYVSTDAFTKELGKIGVPTAASGASFQQNLTRMNVRSNVAGIVTGDDLAGGNIEFWPNSYRPANAANVPNASTDAYDFGDDMSGQAADGYGSMQIHNHDAKQTLFALNNWTTGQGADLGIGNQANGSPDWTFAKNVGSYSTKRLRVLVHCP
jgi:sialate O-acetylesterase